MPHRPGATEHSNINVVSSEELDSKVRTEILQFLNKNDNERKKVAIKIQLQIQNHLTSNKSKH